MKRGLSILIGALLGLVAQASRDFDRMPPFDARLLVSFNRGDASDMSWAKRTPTVGAGFTFTDRAADLNGGATAVASFPDDDKLDAFPLTVICWMRIDAYTSFRSIVAKIPQTGAITGWRMYHAGGISRGLGFFYGTNASNYRQTWTAVGTLSAGAWFHVAATVGAVGENPVLYINGEAPSVTVNSLGTVTTFSNSEPVRIGALGGSEVGWIQHDGQIDNVVISSRVWSAAEIAAHYASGRP